MKYFVDFDFIREKDLFFEPCVMKRKISRRKDLVEKDLIYGNLFRLSDEENKTLFPVR